MAAVPSKCSLHSYTGFMTFLSETAESIDQNQARGNFLNL